MSQYSINVFTVLIAFSLFPTHSVTRALVIVLSFSPNTDDAKRLERRINMDILEKKFDGLSSAGDSTLTAAAPGKAVSLDDFCQLVGINVAAVATERDQKIGT